ncbi:hypothetical protein ACGF12_13670 [Kitasatospora sp. NPDC048296]|uniref:hypothetical protein n=1 Tax=Kitasatospora sp. NPDC048296 TaxID=3364048 RepID=UPI0037185CD7
MTTNESREAMRAAARSPEAFAGYVADIQSRLLGIASTLSLLAQETQVELRGTHVEGDRPWDARVRAWRVERPLRELITSIENAVTAAEKVNFRRRKHDEKVAALPAQRAAKALEKANKRTPKTLPVNKSAEQVPPPTKTGYAEPQSIFDLRDVRDRKSA